jgi:hypothetical protein
VPTLASRNILAVNATHATPLGTNCGPNQSEILSTVLSFMLLVYIQEPRSRRISGMVLSALQSISFILCTIVIFNIIIVYGEIDSLLQNVVDIIVIAMTERLLLLSNV